MHPLHLNIVPSPSLLAIPGGGEEEEEGSPEFITSVNWRGKHNLLSRVADADQEEEGEGGFISNRTHAGILAGCAQGLRPDGELQVSIGIM